jgi:hypothetical protein
MEPDEDESGQHPESIGRAILIGMPFGVITWWEIYRLVVALID